MACTPFLAQGKASTLRVDVGNRVIHANTLPGTPVYSKTFSWNEIGDGSEEWVTCDNGQHDDRDFDFKSFMSGVAQSPEIYPTNLNGLGVRISLRAVSGYGGFPARMTTVPFTARVHTPAGQSDNAFRMGMFQVKVELLKTASAVASGDLDYRANPFLFAGNTAVASIEIQGKIKVGACTLSASSPTTVQLPPTNLNKFERVGDTAGDMPFALQLDCNSAVGVKLRLEGNESTFIKDKGVLKNDASHDRAQGIGVQLLYQNAPVIFNKEMDMGMATEGQYAIPLRARYYQTQRRVTAGQVNAVATYTLTYY
ncbi:type 1 fimbrial protein [Leclercia adecarboxylata]|uniref:fimbrial protein n=1 Tax=Leclercia adecarboxylata TaxID=83655 RepID=UPI002DBB0149|nr:fimbrial protein [Leclercia adecarboxylata]MEB6377628.1 type 1 fimbrial protein [Leclercia adecarboxylata]